MFLIWLSVISKSSLPYLNIYHDETPAEGALTPEETNFFTGLDGVKVPATTAEQPQDEAQEAEPEAGADPEAEPVQ